jgi:hypothetical protein
VRSADVAGPIGLGCVLIGLMIGGSTEWLAPAFGCVVVGVWLLALSR